MLKNIFMIYVQRIFGFNARYFKAKSCMFYKIKIINLFIYNIFAVVKRNTNWHSMRLFGHFDAEETRYSTCKKTSAFIIIHIFLYTRKYIYIRQITKNIHWCLSQLQTQRKRCLHKKMSCSTFWLFYTFY